MILTFHRVSGPQTDPWRSWTKALESAGLGSIAASASSALCLSFLMCVTEVMKVPHKGAAPAAHQALGVNPCFSPFLALPLVKACSPGLLWAF